MNEKENKRDPVRGLLKRRLLLPVWCLPLKILDTMM